jgi:hypothetical protein
MDEEVGMLDECIILDDTDGWSYGYGIQFTLLPKARTPRRRYVLYCFIAKPPSFFSAASHVTDTIFVTATWTKSSYFLSPLI